MSFQVASRGWKARALAEQLFSLRHWLYSMFLHCKCWYLNKRLKPLAAMWSCLDMVWTSVWSDPITSGQLCACAFRRPCYQVRAATLEAKVQQITCMSREAAAALHLEILRLIHTPFWAKIDLKMTCKQSFLHHTIILVQFLCLYLENISDILQYCYLFFTVHSLFYLSPSLFLFLPPTLSLV